MNVRKAETGEILFQENETANTLSIVAEGIVRKSNAYTEGTADKGCLLGFCSQTEVVYPFTYTAIKPVTLYQYDYAQPEDLTALLSENQDACGLIAGCTAQKFSEQLEVYDSLLSSCQTLYDRICEENEKYLKLCTHYQSEAKILPGIEQLGEFTKEGTLDEWLVRYYTSVGSFAPAKWKVFYENNIDAGAGFIMKADADMLHLLSCCKKLSQYLDMIYDLYLSEYKLDLFTYYLALLEDVISKKTSIGPIVESVENLVRIIEHHTKIEPELINARFTEYRNLVPASERHPDHALPQSINAEMVVKIKNSLHNSLNTITSYAELEDTDKNLFYKLIRQYIDLPDRSASDDLSRTLRKELSGLFYETYKKAFFKSLQDPALPTELKMFFYFGYIDETLAGIENAVYLYYLAEKLQPDEKGHVFIFYDWLIQIYNGKKDPCINDLNIDYAAYLHRLKIEGKLTEAQEAADLADGAKRVLYEFDNMFRSTNRMISGHITTFCPLFSDHELYGSLDRMLLTGDGLNKMLQQFKAIDFSLFYRETIFTAPEIGIQKELIQVEVLPDIILMPGFGTRGVMWQEITGRKRTSPARFILPMFLAKDLIKIMLHLCGEFRWEMCRRIQGARWNDLGERSLTSDYCDYLQTFKRSHDLSPEVRDRIKSAYAKYRNSSKEMFVNDYMDYMQAESVGSLRLNKLSRAILFDYCPFSAAVREAVSTNRIYKELTDRYQIKHAHIIRLSDLSMQKIEKSGHAVPALIREHRRFLEM
ncbi:MAG: hypothetical protein QM697_05985 [Lachnospiraceae bacterium]